MGHGDRNIDPSECPKCGKKWTETHPLSESEYKQVIADYITKVTDLVTLKKA